VKFTVKRYWQLCDEVEVEGRTRDEAIDIAHQMPLDESRGSYVSGSLNSDPDQDVAPILEKADGVNGKVPIAKFRLGHIVTASQALSQLSQEEILLGIQRHQSGDWGDLYAHERNANDLAVVQGKRIWSVYHTSKGVKFYVITEGDRSATSVLLPDEY